MALSGDRGEGRRVAEGVPIHPTRSATPGLNVFAVSFATRYSPYKKGKKKRKRKKKKKNRYISVHIFFVFVFWDCVI